MKISDFNLADLLHFEPLEGRLTLGATRMLLFRQDAFAFLRTLLLEQLGETLTRAVLTQFGYRCGFGDYQELGAEFECESDEDRLRCGPLMHTWEGLVHVTPLEMDFDRNSGRFLFRGIWRNSYEAEIHRSRFALSERPVCASLTGYASGWCSAFFGRPVLAIETECRGKGDDRCCWIARDVESWGADNREATDARLALEATSISIARDLEHTIDQRTVQLAAALERVERQNEALSELDRMKTEFIANVSHELRTPLTLVLSPIESMLERPLAGLGEEARPDLERMLRNGRRLRGLVDELLDFSRLDAGQARVRRQPVDLGRHVASLVDDVRQHAERQGLELDFEPPEGWPLISLDIGMFERILINLLGNAVKFTPAGGRIRVALECDEHDVLLHVSDTGPGIAEHQHKQIFERFRQADASSTRKHEGTGLGLALVKEFSELLGGSVSLESAPGAGCRFTVRLPKHPAAVEPGEIALPGHEDGVGSVGREEFAAAHDFIRARPIARARTEPEVGEGAAPARPRVIVAEDNADMRQYIVQILADDYRVEAVADGREALAAARRQPADVILSDLMMPRMDGIELTREIKADPVLHNTPVVLLTARAGSGEAAAALDKGAHDFITKPFAADELHARVRAACRLHRTIRELERSNRELDAFAYSVSHDMRGPLRSIAGYSAIVEEDCAQLLPEQGRRHLARIRASCLNLSELIDDLLKLSRISRTDIKRERVDLGKLCEEVLAELRQREPNRRVRTTVAANLEAFCDPHMARLLLANLLGNAWKYSKPTEQAHIEVGVAARAPTPVFFVRDNGVGFDMAHADKLFGAFQRLHGSDEFEGTGVGLAIVERIVGRHGGRASGEGTVGEGATFYFSLAPA